RLPYRKAGIVAELDHVGRHGAELHLEFVVAEFRGVETDVLLPLPEVIGPVVKRCYLAHNCVSFAGRRNHKDTKTQRNAASIAFVAAFLCVFVSLWFLSYAAGLLSLKFLNALVFIRAQSFGSISARERLRQQFAFYRASFA